MNKNNLTYLLNHPEAINETQTQNLESVLMQYPYFQSARALYLKGLYSQNSFRYNFELKKTAAYTTDRTILFHFITSENFTTISNEAMLQFQKEIEEIEVFDFEIVDSSPTITANFEIEKPTEAEIKLELDKPIPFDANEKHSFYEWLQLTKATPIDRKTEENRTDFNNNLQKKIEIIDKFIEANPKIKPVDKNFSSPINISKTSEEPTHLMTETLAKVFLQQKKYSKAIQAYEILFLKYPEKSSFFASKIKDIKEFQQNNK